MFASAVIDYLHSSPLWYSLIFRALLTEPLLLPQCLSSARVRILLSLLHMKQNDFVSSCSVQIHDAKHVIPMKFIAVKCSTLAQACLFCLHATTCPFLSFSTVLLLVILSLFPSSASHLRRSRNRLSFCFASLCLLQIVQYGCAATLQN